MLKENRISAASSIAPAVHTAGDVTGDEVDLAGYEAASVVLEIGAVTDGDYTITVEESDTSGSGFTTVAAADLDGTFTTPLVADTLETVEYHGTKQFIRAVATDGGTGNAAFVVGVVRGAPRRVAPPA